MRTSKLIFTSLIAVCGLALLIPIVHPKRSEIRPGVSVEEIHLFLNSLRGHLSSRPYFRIRIQDKVFEPVIGEFPAFLQIDSQPNWIFFVTKESKSRSDGTQRIHIFDIAAKKEIYSAIGWFYLDEVGLSRERGGVYIESGSSTQIVVATAHVLEPDRIDRLKIYPKEQRVEEVHPKRP